MTAGVLVRAPGRSMAPLTDDIIVLHPAGPDREDLVRRLRPLTAGEVTTAASADEALAAVADGRRIVVVDRSLPDARDLGPRLALAGATAGIVPLGLTEPDGAPGDAMALPRDPSDAELGIALGRAAQLTASSHARKDAELELDAIASLMPDTGAMLVDRDLVCRVARGPLITRTRQVGLELEGANIKDLSGSQWEHVRGHWDAVFTGERRQFDFHDPANGTTHRTDLLPRTDGSGVVTAVVCVIAEVSAQRRAEVAEAEAREQLARSEAWYRAMVDHLHEGVTLSRADGTWLANESAHRILGLTMAHLTGAEPIPEGWVATDGDGAPLTLPELPVNVARRTGEPIHDRLLGQHLPDGSFCWRLVSAQPIPSLTVPGRHDVLASFVDVTAQVETERALAREHAALAEAQAIARVGSWRLDLGDGTWTWSDELSRIVGQDPGAPPPPAFDDFLARVHPDDQQIVERAWADRSGGHADFSFRLRRPSGTIAHLHVRAHPERDADGRIVALSGVVQDVTDRQEAELALRAAQRRFEAAFDEAPTGMVLMDADGRNVRVNRAMCELTGHTAATLLSMRHGVSADNTPDPEDVEAVDELLAGRRTHWSAERRLVAADGRTVWVQLSAARLQAAPDEPPMILTHYLDISHRHRLERRLRHLAEHDPLTGVPNRRAWEAQVPQAIEDAQRTGAPLGVALLDLNGFKAVNDTHGHDAGDRVLREVAAAWRSQLRDSDLLARLGGDEFAVLLPDCGEQDLEELARRLRTALHYEAGCSVGAVTWVPGESVADVLRRADAALYRDKVTPGG